MRTGPSLREMRPIAPGGWRWPGSRAVPRSAGDLLGVLYSFSFFEPASAVAGATAGSRLNANDQPEDDGTQFVERREPWHIYHGSAWRLHSVAAIDTEARSYSCSAR